MYRTCDDGTTHRFGGLSDSGHDGSDRAIAARTGELERFPNCRTDARGDVVAEQRPRAMETSLHCLRVDVQAGRRFGRTQALHLAQHEDRAVDLWQRIHGVLDGLAELMVSRALLRACGSRGKSRHALLEVGAGPRFRTCVIDHRAARSAPAQAARVAVVDVAPEGDQPRLPGIPQMAEPEDILNAAQERVG